MLNIKKIMFIGVMVTGSVVQADEFKIDYNPYLPLCQGLKTYLEQHADGTHWCSVPKDNTIKGVTNVKWQLASKELATKLVKELYTKFPNYKYPDIAYKIVRLNQLLEDLPFMELHQTRVDLDHNGQVENVLRIMDKRCDQKYGFIMNIAFNDKYQLDEAFYLLERSEGGNEYSENSRKLSNVGRFGNDQIILYHGRSYLFSAAKNSGYIGEPHSNTSRLFIKPVCSVRKKLLTINKQ